MINPAARHALRPLAAAAGAAGDVAEGSEVAGVGIDSRRLTPGAMFVAVRGERFDGHDYAAEACQAGASAVLLEAGQAAPATPAGVPRLTVADTRQALASMAGWWRRRWGGPLVAITGSNGKTTTKELTAAALAAGGSVHKTAGNLNNLLGLPLTLLNCPASAAFQVVELGMNAPGEIAELAALAGPSVALVTCVDAAHLGGRGLGSLAAIARAKAEIFGALTAGGTAIVNRDDEQLAAALPAPWPDQVRVLGFGRHPDAEVRVLACDGERAGSRVTLAVGREQADVRLPLWGGHQAGNAAAALAAAWALGIPVAAAARSMAAAALPPGRVQLRRRDDGVTVVDATKNPNPGALRAAAATLLDLAGGHRAVVAIGDMLELGEQAEALHAEAGRALAQLGVGEVWATGSLAAHLARAAGDRGRVFASAEALAEALAPTLRPGDWVLVKGSRGARMERVVAPLLATPRGAISRDPPQA